MDIQDYIEGLPVAVDGPTGRLGNHAVVHAGLQDHEERLATMESLPLRLDTTVGTRIFAGDTMIYGDTGWRATTTWGKDGSLTGTLPGGIAGQEGVDGGIFYRRVNGTVTLRILAGVAVSSNPQIPIPSGFAPGGAPWPVVALSIASTSRSAYGRVGASYFYAGVTGASASDPVNLPSSGPSYSSEATWHTDRAWPTTLPGLPA